MIKSKNIIFNFIFIVLGAIFLFIIINAVLHRDYLALIIFFSIMFGYIVYQIFDIKVIKRLRNKAKNKELFSAIIWIISFILVVTNFVLYLLSHHEPMESVYKGLICPTIYYLIKYWNIWMEDNEIDKMENIT